MEALCDGLGLLVHLANDILQQALRQTKPSSKDYHSLEVLNNCSISDKMVSLISELSRTSIQANKLRANIEARDQQSVKCLKALRDLVKKQQEEIKRLSFKPSNAEIGINTLEYIDEEKEKYKKV
jgi:hypothetical protein